MKKMIAAVIRLQIWKDTQGQDLIEYSLMAGLIAVSAVAVVPSITTAISKAFSSVGSTITSAAGS
jgi:pilus assembly protein Flp/PilA